MRYLVYQTEQFQDDLDGSHVERIEKLIADVESSPTLRGGFQRYPRPYLKKRIRNHRLIAEEYILENDGGTQEAVVLCFVRFVPRSDDDYKWLMWEKPERFKSTYNLDYDTVEQWAWERLSDDELEPLPELTDRDYKYLYWANSQQGHGTDDMVYETATWIDIMKSDDAKSYHSTLAKAVQEVVVNKKGDTEYHLDGHDAGVLFRRFRNPSRTVLIAPIFGSNGDTVDQARSEHADLLNADEELEPKSLLKEVRRAYPELATYYTEQWMKTQDSEEANLALSPEEAGIINDIMDEANSSARFPLFINGRPGSGKSTVLQYLFASMLSFHLDLSVGERFEKPPLYLTYSDALLERATNVVKDILKFDAARLVEEEDTVGLEPHEESIVDEAFGSFRDFMLELLPDEIRREYQPDKYVDYSKFRSLWMDKFCRLSKHEQEKLSPELSWHVIRTYIKGMRTDAEDEFDPEAYSDYPEKRKSVTEESFNRIYDRVWQRWYREICEQEGYWDDQDLTRQVLDLDQSYAEYPAIFCDEAQDFTRQELEFIFSLSRYSKCDVPRQHLEKIPFAFAGDPFQTLNPTGFNWDAVKADFHENIIDNFGKGTGAVDFNFQELQYNYRASEDIAKLGNTIQLLRGVGFELPRLEPQMVYFQEDSAPPEYFSATDATTKQRLNEQEEVVIIVPCSEGGEKSFVEDDALLSEFALDDDGELTRNVLSPMRAKGLEFKRVVIYGFGEQALQEPTVRQLVTGLEPLGYEQEKKLPAEYFLNQLYVAASRAQLRLLIVDRQEAIEKFWRFAIEGDALTELLESYEDAHADYGVSERRKWTTDDICKIRAGSRESWEKNRDEPAEIARKFFDEGKSNGDAYMLERAARLYESLGKEVEEKQARALACECNEEWIDAGELHEMINAYDDAIRCYWKAREFEAIVEIERGALQERQAEHRVAVFLSEAHEFQESIDFLSDLTDWLDDPKNESRILRDSVWQTVGPELLDTFGSLAEHDRRQSNVSQSKQWRIVLGQLMSCREHGLDIPKNLNFIRVAHQAGKDDEVARAWDELQTRPPMEDWLAHSLAQAKPYPDKLVYLADLEAWDDILEAYDHHGDEEVSGEAADAIVRALLDDDRVADSLEFLEQSPSTNAIERLLALAESELHPAMATRLAERLLQRYVQEGRFTDALRTPKRGGDGPNAWSHVEEHHLIEFLIHLLARSSELTEAQPKVKQKVSEFLMDQARTHREAVSRGIASRVHGAAIERAGDRRDALRYYESVFKTVSWHEDKALKTWGRLRWAHVMRIHIESLPERVRSQHRSRYQKHLDRHDFTEEMILGLPKYPRRTDLPALNFTDVETERAEEQAKQLEAQQTESNRADATTDEDSTPPDAADPPKPAPVPDDAQQLYAGVGRVPPKPVPARDDAAEGSVTEAVPDEVVAQDADVAVEEPPADPIEQTRQDLEQEGAKPDNVVPSPSLQKETDSASPAPMAPSESSLENFACSLSVAGEDYELNLEAEYSEFQIKEKSGRNRVFVELETPEVHTSFMDVEEESEQEAGATWTVPEWEMALAVAVQDDVARLALGNVDEPPSMVLCFSLASEGE